MDLFQIARDLISRESTTGHEEPVAAYLEEALTRMGLAVQSQPVSKGRRNILAGPERPSVIFCTHMDTVPPYLPLSEDDRFLHGRGACDTKGIIACMLECGSRLLAEGKRDFGYLFVVGEEVDNAGAKAANRIVRGKYLIVGEPTENKVAVGHKGVLGVRVKVKGIPCHSAYPDQGDSAVHRLLFCLSRLLSADFGRSDLLGPFTVNIGQIHGGVAPNVLAPSAEATVTVRVVGDMPRVERTLEQCFHEPQGSSLDPRIELETYTRMVPPPLERVEGFPETIVSFGTDIPFLADVGKPILFGPGSILDAHTSQEKIAKKAMLEAVEAYGVMARKLMSRG